MPCAKNHELVQNGCENNSPNSSKSKDDEEEPFNGIEAGTKHKGIEPFEKFK